MRSSLALVCIRSSIFALPVFVAIACASTPDNGNNGDAGSPGSSGSSGGSGGSGGIGSSTGGSGGGNSGGSSGVRADGGASSSGSGGGGSNSSGSGSGGSSGASSSGSSSSGVVVPTDGGARSCPPANANVISDFEETGGAVVITQSMRTGPWGTYADSTASPAMPAPNAAGLTPVSPAPAPAMCNANALHVSASGHPMYSGIEAPLKGSGAATTWAKYDVSAFDGIQFDIKTGAASQGPVYFEVLTTDTRPGASGGGTGTATTAGIDLNNNRGYVLSATGSNPTGTSTAIPTAMTTVYVPFSLLVPRYFPDPAGCGTAKCQAPAFNPLNALGIQFSTYNDFSTTGAYDLWLDNISFYTGDNGLNPANPTAAPPAFKDGSAGWTCARPTFLGTGTSSKTAAGKYLLWAYRNWKRNFVAPGPGAGQFIVKSPEVNGGSVVSEGIAYGLLIAAYMGDQPLFDGLWSYWASKAATGLLMNWRYDITGANMTGGGSATDSDEDAAFALHVASVVWPGTASYATNFNTMVGQIWTSDFDHTTNLPTFGSNAGGSSNPTNPSYFAPAYYPIFGANFANATAAAYAALNRVSSAGLPPAWCNGGNCAAAGSNGLYVNDTAYQYDAHRVPWRVGIDFCWNGSTAASGYLNHISQFFGGQVATGGIDSLYDQYTTGGNPGICTGCTPAAQPNSMSLIGTAAVGALAGANTPFVNAAWQFVLDGLNRGTPNVAATGNNYYTYFNSTVGLLTAITMSGNFYKP